MGAMSIIFYRTDKAQAVKDGWRAPETTLHATDLVFGVIGGLFAQGWFGHKMSKSSYNTVTAIIALGHAALLLVAGFGAPETVHADAGVTYNETDFLVLPWQVGLPIPPGRSFVVAYLVTSTGYVDGNVVADLHGQTVADETARYMDYNRGGTTIVA